MELPAIITLTIVAIITIIMIIQRYPSFSKKEFDKAMSERRKKLAEKLQKEAEEKEKIQKELEKKEIEKYGNCTKSIKWWFDSRTYLIRVYEEFKKGAWGLKIEVELTVDRKFKDYVISADN